MIIDNFLDNPMAARSKALALRYDSKGNYAGQTSDRPLDLRGHSEAVSKHLNLAVKPADGTLHMHCRLTLKGDKGKTGVHIDPCFYSGILYLNLPEQCQGGTNFYTHRRTGQDGVPTRPTDLMAAGYASTNEFVEDVVNKDTFKPGRWQKSMQVPMRFNRLILFSPWLFHNAAPGFGTDRKTGRLVGLMFFNAGS